MSNFNIGDRIRVARSADGDGSNNGYYFKVGDTGVVTHVGTKDIDVRLDRDDRPLKVPAVVLGVVDLVLAPEKSPSEKLLEELIKAKQDEREAGRVHEEAQHARNRAREHTKTIQQLLDEAIYHEVTGVKY